MKSVLFINDDMKENETFLSWVKGISLSYRNSVGQVPIMYYTAFKGKRFLKTRELM
jgi:hypothetical protein